MVKGGDSAIIIIILSPGCQQPFLVKMASDNRLSAAILGPKRLVTTGCQQPLPFSYFSLKPYVVTPHLNRLDETIQMRGHNICFYAELIKIITYYHQTFPLF